MATVRTHIALPEGLLEELDQFVGRRQRSAFIAAAIESQLRSERQKSAAARGLASVERPDVPDWDDPDEWVRKSRESCVDPWDEVTPAPNGTSTRTHVVLPEPLLESIDKRVDERRRSAFIVAAVQERLRQTKLIQAMEEWEAHGEPVEVEGWDDPAGWVDRERSIRSERMKEIDALG